MRDEQLTPLERMIRAARSCPDPSAELRRQTLAKSVRAYHERVQKRRTLIAASLLFGFVWMAGSARQLFADPERRLAEGDHVSQQMKPDSPIEAAFSHADEWQAVERTLQARSRRYDILKSALALGQNLR